MTTLISSPTTAIGKSFVSPVRNELPNSAENGIVSRSNTGSRSSKTTLRTLTHSGLMENEARLLIELIKNKMIIAARVASSSHQAAVRALAFKWIRILYRCWQSGKRYDESVYLNALRRRGSPLLGKLSLSDA